MVPFPRQPEVQKGGGDLGNPHCQDVEKAIGVQILRLGVSETHNRYSGRWYLLYAEEITAPKGFNGLAQSVVHFVKYQYGLDYIEYL